MEQSNQKLSPKVCGSRHSNSYSYSWPIQDERINMIGVLLIVCEVDLSAEFRLRYQTYYLPTSILQPYVAAPSFGPIPTSCVGEKRPCAHAQHAPAKNLEPPDQV